MKNQQIKNSNGSIESNPIDSVNPTFRRSLLRREDRLVAHHAKSKRLKRNILLACTFVMMMSCNMAGAATKFSQYFIPKKVWFDKDNIYILYVKRSVKSHYSLKDIHGTIIDEKNEFFTSRLPREVGSGSKQFRLGSGIDASSIIYQDNDFNISTIGDEVKLTGNKISTVLNKCNEAVWSSQEVIRVRDSLLYCGSIYDQSGNRVLEIPKDIALAIERDYHEHTTPLSSLVSISAISSGKLLIVRPNPGDHISTLRVGIWQLNSDQKFKWISIDLPDSKGGYEVDTYRTYSPESFVLRPVDNESKWVLICNEKKCEQVNVHDRYSITVIDEEHRILMEVENEIAGSEYPSITINTSKY